MSTHDRSRQIVIHGLLLVMVGLLWGFVVPHTPHPRLALGAHVQFVTNGVLILVMAALLLTLPHTAGATPAAVMLVAAWPSFIVGWLFAAPLALPPPERYA